MWLLGVISLLYLTPSFARAQSLIEIIDVVEIIVNLAIPFALLCAGLAFFWGMMMFIIQAGNEQERAKGKTVMIWGVIALFVIVSIWGLVAFLSDLFGVNMGGACPPPQIIGNDQLSTC